MTETEQRRAIAEACKWEIRNLTAEDWRHWHVKHPVACLNWDSAGPNLPDYLNDLNAMHEAEKKLHLNQRNNYIDQLFRVCEKAQRMASVPGWLIPTATAAQRAEAFLRTLNLWKSE